MSDLEKLVATLTAEYQKDYQETDNSLVRSVTMPTIANKIRVAVGMRRTGKTYLLFQKINALLRSGVPAERILYINFEDDRLIPRAREKLAGLIDAFYSLHPDNHDNLCYLFLDEIQTVEDWPIVIRRFHDTKKVEIYLSESSSKLLSKEIATSLRGRSLSIEVWPYSFAEYLTAKKIIKPTGRILSKPVQDKLKQYLLSYLEVGGFPETVDLQSHERHRLLQDYVSLVIMKDIIERHKITNISLIKYMIKTLLKNFSTNFSANKFFNDLKSQGMPAGITTISNYLEYIDDAFLAFTVPLYSESIRKTQSNPRKIYTVDPGLANAYSMSFSNNIGRLFENVVYLELRRREHEIYYYLTDQRYEVDFYTKTLDGKKHLYQVVWNDYDEATMARETRALQLAEKELGIKGKIITPEVFLTEFS